LLGPTDGTVHGYAQFSRDGKKIVSSLYGTTLKGKSCKMNQIQIWHIDPLNYNDKIMYGELQYILDGHHDSRSIIYASFSNDGNLLVSVDTDGKINVWNLQHGGGGGNIINTTMSPSSIDGATTRVTFSPDNQCIAIAKTEGIIYWNWNFNFNFSLV
jgi:WD40 repeat protein